MFSNESPALLGLQDVLHCRPCRSSGVASSQTGDCDAFLANNGFDFALRKSHLEFIRAPLKEAKTKSLSGSRNTRGKVNANCNAKYFKIDSLGSPLVPQRSSPRCDSTSLTEVKDERSRSSSLDKVNDADGDLTALIDGEENSGDHCIHRIPSSNGAHQVDVNPKGMTSYAIAQETRNVRSDSCAQARANYLDLSHGSKCGVSTSSTGPIEDGDGKPRSEEFLSGIVAALATADSTEKVNRILSSTLGLSSSDFSTILNSLKSPKKVTELVLWMQDKGKTNANFEAYITAFKVLGRRQDWSVIDSFLMELAFSFEGEECCKAFNTVFHACFSETSLDWAIRWFRLMLKENISPDDTTYTLLMSLFKRFGKLEEAEFVYQEMVKAGGRCPKAYSAMLYLYTRAGQFDKVEQIINKMKEKSVKRGREHWLLLLDAYVRQGKVQESQEVMKCMQESGVTPDIFAYNSMITVSGKANDFKGAREWFHRLEEGGLQPDVVTYRSLIGACGRAGKLKEALLYYDRMRLLGFCPSVHNFNTLIHLHRKGENDEKILCLLSDMKEMNCCPDFSTLDAVVKVYERYGKLERIPQALKLLQAAGWSPNLKCYSILIRAYIRCHLVDQALDAFNYLCSRARLEESLCHNLICLCKTAGRYEEAVHVFQEMKRSGLQPNVRTFCTVIDICSLKGGVDGGAALFNELRSSGQVLDSVAYNVTINMYMRAGLFQKAAEVLKLVNEHKGFQPDSYLYLSMLRVCAKCGLHKESVDIYWRMVKSKLTWNEALYNGVIHCCGRALPLEEITKVFQAMVYAKVPVNNVTCNLMIDIFGKAGLLELAEKVLRMAQTQGVVDSISFNTIIGVYGKYKEFNKMEAALIEMQNYGFKGCIEAFNSMLDAYGKSGQIGKMENILERMKRAGCSPNMSTFNTLINVYGKEGLIVELRGVLKKLEEAGMKPDHYTYNTLIYAYGNAEMPDEAMRSFKEMQDAGFLPDRITYACLISAFEKSENHLEAARWSLWMTQIGMSR